MRVIDIEINKVKFNQKGSFKILLQDRISTEFSHEEHHENHNYYYNYENNYHQCPLYGNQPRSNDMLKVTIIKKENNEEVVMATETIQLAVSKDPLSCKVKFSNDNSSSTSNSPNNSSADTNNRGTGFKGSIELIYKIHKKLILESLQSYDTISCFSISAAYLNSNLEKPFDMKVRILKGFEVMGAVRLNNKNFFSYLDVANGNVIDNNGVVATKDNDNARKNSVDSTDNSQRSANSGGLVLKVGMADIDVLATPLDLKGPVSVSIPSSCGEPIILTIQHVKGSKIVTSVIHSCIMKETSINEPPKRRLSVSPRRMSSVVPPINKKSLLFIEEAPIINSSESNNHKYATSKEIINGVIAAKSLKSNNKLLNNSNSSTCIDNINDIGPSTGLYVISGTRSDSSAEVDKRKLSKKQVHGINLGVIKLNKALLSNPIKLRACLMDLVYSYNTNEEMDKVDGKVDPEVTHTPSRDMIEEVSKELELPQYDPKVQKDRDVINSSNVSQLVNINYSGFLEESSREIYNDTGIISCTLDGKLYKVSDNSNPGVTNSALLLGDNSLASRGLSDPRTHDGENCMAIKLYLSIVPVGSFDKGVDSDDEKDSAASTSDSKALSKANSQANSKISLHQDPSVPSIGETNNHNENEELAGSSAMTSQQSAADLMMRMSTKDLLAVSSSVPQLPLDGQVPVATKTVSPPTESLEKEIYGQLPVGKHGSAFGEMLDPKAMHAAVAAATGLAESNKNSATLFAEVIRGELVEKQKLIEKLLDEVNQKNEAIQIVGKDIRELREDKIVMQKKVQERDNELAELQQKEVEAQRQCEKLLLNQKSIDDLDKETLVKVMNSFRNKLVATNNEKKELQQVVAEAKNTIVKYKDLKSDYQTLEDAHLEQNKYIQSMKQKIGQVDKYQITIQTQEKIIAKMQSVIDSKFRGKSKLQDKQPIPDHANNFLEKSQLEEKERLLEAKEEELKIKNDRIEHLAGKVDELEAELHSAKIASHKVKSKKAADDSDDDSVSTRSYSTDFNNVDDGNELSKIGDLKEANKKIDQLQAEITSKGYRITALEKQLETTTRESSREIARLRTKLFELEMNAMSSEADDQDVNNFSLFDNPDFQVPAEFRKFHQIDEDDSGSGMKHNGSGKSLPSGSGSTAVNALRKTNSNTGNDDNIIDPEVLSEKLKHVEIDGARPEKTDSPELPEDIGKSLSDKGMRRISPNESVQRNISAKLNIDDGTLPVLAEGPDGMEDSRNVSMDDYDVMPTVKDRKQPLERIASAEGSPEKIPSNRSINVEKDGEILRTNNDVIDLKKTEDVTADIDTSNLLTNSTKIPKLEQKIARRLSTVSAFPKGKRVTKEVYIMDTNEDKPTACGRLKITFHTDTELKISDDPIIEQTIHNYWISKVEFRNEKKVDTKDHYNPYISFQIGTIWRGQTDVIEDTGLIAEWEYNQMEIESCGMMFSLTDDELKTNSILQCQVSDQSGYDDEDLLIGSGTMFLALEN